MTPKFESETKRRFWQTIGFGVITDYGIATIAARVFGNNWGESFTIAIAILLAAYLFLGLYRLICAGRAILLYKYKYREEMVADMLSKMEQAKMPLPRSHYLNPKDYLLEVASSDGVPSEAKVYAAMLLGRLTALGELSVVPTMTLNFALEEAIKRYSQRMTARGLNLGG